MFHKKRPEDKDEEKEKKKKGINEQYVPIPGILGIGDDYHIYTMTVGDRLTGAVLGIGTGVAVGYVFFDSWTAAVILSLILAWKIQAPFREYLRKKR